MNGALWVPMSPIFCICPAHLVVCWTQQGSLSWRLIASSLSSQLAAVSFPKPLSMEGVGRLGPTEVKVEERFFNPLVVWVNCRDRKMCQKPLP